MRDQQTAQKKAHDLLEEENQHSSVICKCFNILGKTEYTEKRAIELLEQENQNPAIIGKCFDILGKEKIVQDKAIELLEQTQDHQVIRKCFSFLEITNDTEMLEYLLEKNKSEIVISKYKTLMIKNFATLEMDEKTKIKYARHFLHYSNNQIILSQSVKILDEEAKSFALNHLKNWTDLNRKLNLLQSWATNLSRDKMQNQP